jgi:hypothetical protein
VSVSVLYSPDLQAPIALAPGGAALAVAPAAPVVVGQASITPGEGTLRLVGTPVRMALAMATLPGSVAFGSTLPGVTSGLVTPASPASVSVELSPAPPLVTVGGAATFDHYISTSGSDSNAGTAAAPWAMTSLQDTNSNNALMAGKRIGFIAGTYNVASMTSGSSPSDYQHPIFHIPSGSSGSPTYVGSSDASGHESPRSAVFVSSSSAGVNAVFGQNPNAGGYWTLSGVVINGNSYPNSLVYASYPTSPGDLYHGAGTGPGITIENCEIYGIAATSVGANEACIFLQGALNAVVRNNKLHDVTKPSQPDHAHGYEEYGSTGTQFIYNTVYNCTSGVETKAGCSGTNVAYNYIFNCLTNALEGFDGAEGNPNNPNTAYAIHHNVFDSNAGCHDADVNNTTAQAINWYSNTVYDTRTGPKCCVDLRSSAASLIAAYDNLVVSTTGSGSSQGITGYSTGGFTLVDYNGYALSSLSSAWALNEATQYSTLAAWQGVAGSPDAHAVVNASPQFSQTIVPGNGAAQFQLGSGSPFKGVGRVGGVSGGAACDMGAWGYDPALGAPPTQIGSNF